PLSFKQAIRTISRRIRAKFIAMSYLCIGKTEKKATGHNEKRGNEHQNDKTPFHYERVGGKALLRRCIMIKQLPILARFCLYRR
ncbi:MAG: hypothetical protein RR280_05460, partial [Bacteroidaceae bacterium]